MKLKKSRALALILALAPSPAIADVSFDPGQWLHETHLIKASVPGIPQWLIRLFAGHSSRTSCNSAVQLQHHPEALLTADGEAVCNLRKFSMSDGHLVFDTFCTNKRFPEGLLVSSRGTYTPTSYAISTISTGTRNGKPARIETTGTGRRVSAVCTKR